MGSTTEVIYRARCMLGPEGGHREFEWRFDMPTDVFEAAKGASPADMAATVALIRVIGAQRFDLRMLASERLRCHCGAEATQVVTNAGSWLHVPPPDGPFIFDIAFPICTRGGACDEIAREEFRSMMRDMGTLDSHVEVIGRR